MSTCTNASAELAEPLAATAATAQTWLLLEQSGPWGAKAFTASHLDPAVGRALEQAADGTGVRVALIRRPGRHADCHVPSRHEVLVAHVVPGRSWVRRGEIGDPAELLELDFAALGSGGHQGFGEPHSGEPVALVCTNGKRDRCCALYGRPLAARLAAEGGSDVWEITHIGGHRFAPTMLVLPSGYAYGRVGADLARSALKSARDDRVALDGCRGASAWDKPGQAADLAVRALTGEVRAAALTVARTDGSAPAWTVRVAHTDGRAWDVDITRSAALPPRPESCGAAPGSPDRMDVTGIRAVAGGR
ncbi:sucrase ferredoxin [Streptomyces sp. H10-C2]|uniref:sucrase ferredoxin n=1 Tax=unclassified Streptomyces TaxID=2593676 RepID=UPI0024B9AC51|nr:MULTISPECIES: sucrase ferredoxin [unclassified Streptomyces]MDJ0341567.1 sucrase ferredoxin [Streptomyces sp. PH10-H1]MDJ0371331.1 sucrase ferredoxin [Streptomyces sp. H10-C2]